MSNPGWRDPAHPLPIPPLVWRAQRPGRGGAGQAKSQGRAATRNSGKAVASGDGSAAYPGGAGQIKPRGCSWDIDFSTAGRSRARAIRGRTSYWTIPSEAERLRCWAASHDVRALARGSCLHVCGCVLPRRYWPAGWGAAGKEVPVPPALAAAEAEACLEGHSAAAGSGGSCWRSQECFAPSPSRALRCRLCLTSQG